MGQQEKARAIVAEKYEFSMSTRLTEEQWVAAARRAAEASKMALKGKVFPGELKQTDSGATLLPCTVKGPAGAVNIMIFGLFGEAADDGTTKVSILVNDFLFQKGSMGMKPTINAGKIMDRFTDILKTELAAG